MFNIRMYGTAGFVARVVVVGSLFVVLPPCSFVCRCLFRLLVFYRTSDQEERFKKAASAKQLQLVSAVDVPACVVVKSGDASDAGEVLQVNSGKGGIRGRLVKEHILHNARWLTRYVL